MARAIDPYQQGVHTRASLEGACDGIGTARPREWPHRAQHKERMEPHPAGAGDRNRVTSSREESDLVECYKLGVNSYVVKPVEFERFVAGVEQIEMYWALLNTLPS